MNRAAFLVLALLAGAAGAQTVTLQGVLGGKALIMVDGSAPKAVAPGESHKEVKVLAVVGDQATVEVAGQRQVLRVGEAPVSVGSGPGGRGTKIVMTADTGGHYLAQGTINNRSARFMVDTGATSVAMGLGDAERLGIDFRRGTPVLGGTANGVVQMWRVKLASVRIGDVEVLDVDGAVVNASMPYVLLGNSFLNRFQMTRDNQLLVLERRY
jgi:aspartyl protease family protein